MDPLIGQRPESQMIKARYIRIGDCVSCADLSFAIVSAVVAWPDIGAMSVTFIDGGCWFGQHDTPFPVAVSRDAAAEWNRRRSELDVAELLELHRQYSNTYRPLRA